MHDALHHGYPVMIGESTTRWVGGVQGGEETWRTWFDPYFTFIRTWPTVKAFCYISWNWEQYGTAPLNGERAQRDFPRPSSRTLRHLRIRQRPRTGTPSSLQLNPRIRSNLVP